MKVNIMRRDNEVIVDYIREKNYLPIRLLAFNYMSDKFGDNLIVYINTNSVKNKTKVDDIDGLLQKYNLQYIKEPAEKIKKKILDLSFLFSKKDKDMSENMYLISLSGDIDLSSLYDELFQYYDYGIGAGSSFSAGELLPRFMDSAEKVLFNKKYFSSTLYDSVLLFRMRMDAPYDSFANFMEEKTGKKAK